LRGKKRQDRKMPLEKREAARIRNCIRDQVWWFTPVILALGIEIPRPAWTTY
jgi:hypothetical protein